MQTEWKPAILPLFPADDDRFVEVDGTRLHYLDTGGDGPPVLLLHGLNQNVRTWEKVLPALAEPWRLIAVDHRGHGLSAIAGVAYRRGDLVQDHVALMRALALDRPVIVGHSLGAWVGLQIAGRYPDLLRGLVVGDMSPNVGVESTPAQRAEMRAALGPGMGDASWADADEAYAAIRATRPELSELDVRTLLPQQLRRRPDGRLERARQPEVALAILEEVQATDSWPLLPSIKVPMLVIRAGLSETLPAAVAERMIQVMPAARLVTIENAHHNVQLCSPQRFGDEIASFLRQVLGR